MKRLASNTERRHARVARALGGKVQHGWPYVNGYPADGMEVIYAEITAKRVRKSRATARRAARGRNNNE